MGRFPTCPGQRTLADDDGGGDAPRAAPRESECATQSLPRLLLLEMQRVVLLPAHVQIACRLVLDSESAPIDGYGRGGRNEQDER